MIKVCILGSGTWAQALCKICKMKNILIKCRNMKIAKKKFNISKINLTEDFKDLTDSDFIFLAIPSQTVRKNLESLKKISLKTKSIFIICCKGVEKKTNKLISEVIRDIFPNNKLAVLSGPNFSSEIIAKKPSASVLSSSNKSISLKVSRLLSPRNFRIYFNNDIIGTQLGGAMKNVIAIACGLVKGKNLGENAKAAIITRGITEIVRLGLKMGAKRNTFYGLSGIGDLTLTCSSLKSRNMKLGYDMAKGKKLAQLKRYSVLEGVESCQSICNLGKIYDVELPLCNSINQIIKGSEADYVISSLLSRPLQYET
tara:strand:+ start:55 stop:993 length:939 start_codon:yes stop_codon:yes gene_type:complete